ncbi:hypothetical protein Vadar_001238 [Vaccinium darrowii]|uniref:Uncharacterized protein n=1 Tax=Vaccinium darrowii TaxID=229202 RepID=A0ACB7X798_9ERIC|nr:hypothetical protein Vadar_001238 [Vaccinium darrowii]
MADNPSDDPTLPSISLEELSDELQPDRPLGLVGKILASKPVCKQRVINVIKNAWSTSNPLSPSLPLLSSQPHYSLSFHTLPKPVLTLSSSLTGPTRIVTALSPSKLFPSSSLIGSTLTVTALSLSSSLTGPTQTVTALLPSIVASKISPPSLFKPSNTLSTAAALGQLFFAPVSNDSAPGMPLVVIAAGLARRCLEIYGRVLLIRFLLSLYPNTKWDQQPMTAIRDLCDPFLSLFRGIIPPLFNSLDVTPILAFLLLGMLAQFTKSPGISR